MRKPQKTDKGSRVLALLGWSQFVAAIAAVLLGVHYDSIEREPGFLVLAGLGVLGGPAFWGAWKLAHGIGTNQGGDRGDGDGG